MTRRASRPSSWEREPRLQDRSRGGDTLSTLGPAQASTCLCATPTTPDPRLSHCSPWRGADPRCEVAEHNAWHLPEVSELPSAGQEHHATKLALDRVQQRAHRPAASLCERLKHRTREPRRCGPERKGLGHINTIPHAASREHGAKPMGRDQSEARRRSPLQRPSAARPPPRSSARPTTSLRPETSTCRTPTDRPPRDRPRYRRPFQHDRQAQLRERSELSTRNDPPPDGPVPLRYTQSVRANGQRGSAPPCEAAPPATARFRAATPRRVAHLIPSHLARSASSGTEPEARPPSAMTSYD